MWLSACRAARSAKAPSLVERSPINVRRSLIGVLGDESLVLFKITRKQQNRLIAAKTATLTRPLVLSFLPRLPRGLCRPSIPLP